MTAGARTSQRCQASISHSAIRFALLGPTADCRLPSADPDASLARSLARRPSSGMKGVPAMIMILLSLTSLLPSFVRSFAMQEERTNTSAVPNRDSSLRLRKSLNRTFLPSCCLPWFCLLGRERVGQSETERRLYREKRQSASERLRPSVGRTQTNERRTNDDGRTGRGVKR